MKEDKSDTTLIGEFKRRFAKSFLDILILQLVESEATWGYVIIKRTEEQYKVKLRHGALYPMLNRLETIGLVKSRRELQKGRVRKIYEITPSGRQLLDAYYGFIRKQMSKKAVSRR